MSSQRQIDANRRNAQLSTGPRTPEGRAAAARNALRHGLTAQSVVLPNENPEEFQELHDAFFAEYSPAGPTESLLVEQMAMAAWRLRRLRAVETGLFEYRISQLRDDIQGLDPRARAFANDATGSRAIEILSRYETRVERSFYRALHELERLRSRPDPEPLAPENLSADRTQSQDRTPAPILNLPQPQLPLDDAPGPELLGIRAGYIGEDASAHRPDDSEAHLLTRQGPSVVLRGGVFR